MKTIMSSAKRLWPILVIQLFFLSYTAAQEAKVDPDLLVAPLPKLLESAEGLSVETAAQWEAMRRGKILELFREHVYGKVSESAYHINQKLVFEDREALGGTAIMKEVVLEVCGEKDSLDLNLLVFLPAGQEGAVPIFLGLNFYGNQSIHPDPQISLPESWVSNNEDFGIVENQASDASRGVRAGRWPVEHILSRGYGLATMYYGDIDPDFDDEFENGIHGLMDPDEPFRDSASWGSIAAWSWGLSRIMDYFESDVEVDHKRVALMGHSRLGKTSLWAGAQDERFALTISNNSGCGGAALSRRPKGERVSRINEVFPHWFAKRFHSYNDNEGALPVDQHMLMALVAPRPLYVASAQEDLWADPRGEYLSLVFGSEVYKLYDRSTGLSEQMPEVDRPVSSGKLGYHMRSGKHDVKLYDWEQYLAFADKHLQPALSDAYEHPLSMEWIQKNLFGTHPRLILTPELEYRLWQQLDTGDSLVSMGLELICRNADSLLQTSPLERVMTGRRLLGVSREAIGRLSTLSLAYRFQQDPLYLERLEQELEALCKFKDWNPSHFLDVAEMATGVALALDWAGEWLSPQVNRMARNALVNKALKPGLESEGDNWWITTDNNWNLVCHGGLSMAALVVFEDEPELATAILLQAVEHIPLALKPYAPGGIYPEGVSYWFYATTYLTAAISSYESALGTDFGFANSPGVMESGVFSQVMAGPSGEYYNFFDSGLDGFQSLTHMGLLSWFSRRSGSGFNLEAYGERLREEVHEMKKVRSSRFFPVHFLSLMALEKDGAGGNTLPEVWSGGGGEPIVILRDSEDDPDAFFLAAKGGRADDNHGNMDAGSFVLEVDGIRWSVDPGNQNYNVLEQLMGMELWNSAQDSRRWSLLTKNSGGHSTLQLNGEMHLVDARASLVRRDLRSSRPEFTFDMSALFGENILEAKRTFSRLESTGLRIRDDLLFSPLTESISWQLITQAHIRPTAYGAVLQQDGARLYLRIPRDVPYELKQVSLSPPPLDYDKDIPGLKRLEIRWKRKDFPGDTAVLDIVLDNLTQE